MTTPLTATLEERLDDSVQQRLRATAPDANAPPSGRLASFVENVVAERFGHRLLVRLAADRGRVAKAWRALPDRMHLVANQTKLMLELVDDFRAGTYRKLPWHSVVIVAAAILYTASPADIVPDVIAGVGVLDDIAVVAIAARVLRKELTAYCEFKGYPVSEYFAA